MWYNSFMDSVFHNVGDLAMPERSILETLMGHPLRNDQTLYIVAMDQTSERDVAGRLRASQELDEILAESHENVRQTDKSADELERAIDEACAKVRYGR